MPLNCGAGEDSWESLGQHGDLISIINEISPEYSFEGLMLKLELHFFGHLMWRTDSLEKTLTLEKIEGRGEGDDRWDVWMASLTRWTWIWANSGSLWWTGRPGELRFMGSQRVGHSWATELNWTELGLPYVNWASQECCLFCLRSSLRSSDLPLFYFHGLSLLWFLATAILNFFLF